ncbi:MAG: type IV pilus twitching motility protein PilT [Candidatus Omnitrophica bacterium]|nr:type IV pilus twitching motility protein PilT [Candidatus Omnitrophota bacterium]
MPSATGKQTVEQLLRLVVEQGANDLHLTANQPPHMRVSDKLIPMDHHATLSGDDVRELAYSLLSQEKIERFERWKELDFAFSVEGVARFRANYFIQQGHVGAAIRMLPFRIYGFEELGLPVQVVTDMCNKTKGLVLVTGATGSGKTTTLAAMVDFINAARNFHIITVEDPIEYVHDCKKSIVDQREVGADTQSFAQALKHVLRQDPDVILIGEMRDLETIETALTVAETGHLVFATLHTSDAASTINRIVDVFPAHQQNQVRIQLSMELLGVIAQQLIPKASGKGRVLAAEVLLANHAVRSLIREQKTHQLYSVIQTGQKDGMKTMNQSLYELYLKQAIALDDALARSGDPDDLMRLVKR